MKPDRPVQICEGIFFEIPPSSVTDDLLSRYVNDKNVQAATDTLTTGWSHRARPFQTLWLKLNSPS
jgi:hypothetical protein